MSLENLEGFIWCDGNLVPWQDSKFHVLSHSLHYGMGVFEGIRSYKTKRGTSIFRLNEHTDRLFESAHILKMKIPYSKTQINEAQKEVVLKNNLESCYIRPICFYGAEGMSIYQKNLKIHIAIAAWDWPSYFTKQSLEKGLRIKTSSYTRHHVNIAMCKAKATGNYMNSTLASQEASDCGFDEALLLDNEGFVAEGSAENFFMVKNNILYTPELSCCLAGITRDTIIQLANYLGIKIIEKRITRDEVYTADEAFFTGTAVEVLPIYQHDGRQIGSGCRGPITTELQSLYFKHVRGEVDLFSNWMNFL